MTTMHAIDLLLQKLPPDACLAHQLPGLVNNLLSLAVLCNAGCEVFFHKTGCKVTLEGATIQQGWRNSKNLLWQVKIVDNGQTTQLTIHDETQPITPLDTTPTGQLANCIPIKTAESDTALANRLYECSNTGQVKNFYLHVS